MFVRWLVGAKSSSPSSQDIERLLDSHVADDDGLEPPLHSEVSGPQPPKRGLRYPGRPDLWCACAQDVDAVEDVDAFLNVCVSPNVNPITNPLSMFDASMVYTGRPVLTSSQRPFHPPRPLLLRVTKLPTPLAAP